MGELFVIVISSMLVSNVVLSQFLGICPFLGVSKKVETAAGMGAAVTFVITIACIITYPVQKCILEPLGLEYLQTIAFILIIAALVQFVEMALKKFMPALYEALGVYLPLITTNWCRTWCCYQKYFQWIWIYRECCLWFLHGIWFPDLYRDHGRHP